jgi:hypothetical protein
VTVEWLSYGRMYVENLIVPESELNSKIGGPGGFEPPTF